MMARDNEQFVEDLASLHFDETGVAVTPAAEIDGTGERGDVAQVVLPGRLGAALRRLNPDLPDDTVNEVARILSRPRHPTLIRNNRWFHALLTDGVEIEYRDPKSGEPRGGRARPIDFDNPTTNDLLVPKQGRSCPGV